MEDLLNSYQRTLENLLSANKSIREIEVFILELTKREEESLDDTTKRISSLIDEFQALLDDVEVRTNRLDVQLSAIERLMTSHE